MHPKSENILKVISAFKSVLPMAGKENNHLDMSQCVIKLGNKYKCGTVHCHGGWFGFAVIKDLESKGYYVSYTEGADLMAIQLGFNSRFDLETWARDNKIVWGNTHGGVMFADQDAFYNSARRPKGAINLQHIIEHWTEVYERVLAIEEKLNSEPLVKEDLRVDITKELAILPPQETVDVKLIQVTA